MLQDRNSMEKLSILEEYTLYVDRKFLFETFEILIMISCNFIIILKTLIQDRIIIQILIIRMIDNIVHFTKII